MKLTDSRSSVRAGPNASESRLFDLKNCNRCVIVSRDPKLNGAQHKPNCATKDSDKLLEMGVEGRRSPSASPERVRVQRQGARGKFFETPCN